MKKYIVYRTKTPFVRTRVLLKTDEVRSEKKSRPLGRGLVHTLLVLIVLLSGFLRFYKLDEIPSSLNWDEIAAGYNAFTIANWGADEYGNKFPITFKNFGDDKHPVHIYITSLVIKFLGLSDFTTRSSSAFIGVVAVISIYFLAKKLFRSASVQVGEIAGIFSALFLAVSPYHLHYSRGLWENNFAFSFLIMGITLFIYGVEKKNWLIPLSFIHFGLSFFSYHSAKVVVPLVVLLLTSFNFKKFFNNKKILLLSVIIALVFGILIIKDVRILGFARINQTKFSEEQINENGGKLQTYFSNYKKYFTYNYLFEKGDQNPRSSAKVTGQFYKLDLFLAMIGIIALLYKRKWKTFLFLLFWLAISPIPGVVSYFEPSATRAMFMLGPVLLISAYGASSLITVVKKPTLSIIISIIIILLLSREASFYLKYYFTSYAKAEAIEWQYGMKQIVEYLNENPKYQKVYMDKIRQQPYIFFLYYMQTPLPELLKTVKYDKSESKSFNIVESFGKYQFGGNWNIIESYPSSGIIYTMTPSFYSGLRYKDQFEVRKLIKYPNGSDAFFIVEGQL